MRHVSLGPVPDFAGLSGWKTTGYAERDEGGQRIICIEAEAEETPVPLHHCDKPKVRANGRRPINVYDAPRGALPVRITYRRQRWECLGCGDKDIVEEPAHLTHGHRMTDRLFRHIVEMAQPNTFAEVSRRVGLTEGTIRNTFRTAREAYEAKPVRAPIVLGLDEKFLFGKPRGVVCDIGRRRLINLLDDRTKMLRPYLEDMVDRDRTRVVVSDMFNGFAQLAREVFPDAKHVIDRFHVVQPANDAIENFRLDLAKAEERKLGIKRSKLRDMVGVLRTRWHKAPLAQQERLVRMFERWPDLHEAYHVKEDFAQIYEMAIGPSQAEDMFDSWAESVPPYLSEWFGNVMFPRYYREMVLNYFDEPYTTGYVEGINAIIGDRWRAGRGYSMDVLRFKFMDRPLDFSAAQTRPVRDPEYVIFDCDDPADFRAPRNAGVRPGLLIWMTSPVHANDDHPISLPRAA